MDNSKFPVINTPAIDGRNCNQGYTRIFQDKPFVFFGTGMSCTLDDRFGMRALKSALCRDVIPDSQRPEQEQQWKKVVESLQEGNDPETALDDVTNELLIQRITGATRRFIGSIDRERALRIAEGKTRWPATKFFERLVNTLPERDPQLHVLTPNYDTLFEHACDAVGVAYTSGFHEGLERRIDWPAVSQSLLLPRRSFQGKPRKNIYEHRKHVRLYKVHG